MISVIKNNIFKKYVRGKKNMFEINKRVTQNCSDVMIQTDSSLDSAPMCP